MGRPLSRQQFFGANANNNIKVHFYNGSTGVQGYILRQRSTKHFLCEDVNGVQRVCKLVDKVRADLLEGEMSIAFKFDDATIGHAVKISRHLITVMYNGMYRNMPWTFTENNSDGYWQIDEAGTNTSMAGATDLGSEDFNGDYPVPGSGGIDVYRAASVALAGVTYADRGTPYDPGGDLASVPHQRNGLYRTKYIGNFSDTSSTPVNSWNYGFFDTATAVKSVQDPYISFGKQLDGNGLGEHNFSMEWKGYIQAPATGNFNMFVECDDQAAVWIGTAATDTPTLASASIAVHGKSLPANANSAANNNSVSLTANRWYPVRIFFGEFGGACMFQLYLQNSTDVFNGQDINKKYNTQTGGF